MPWPNILRAHIFKQLVACTVSHQPHLLPGWMLRALHHTNQGLPWHMCFPTGSLFSHGVSWHWAPPSPVAGPRDDKHGWPGRTRATNDRHHLLTGLKIVSGESIKQKWGDYMLLIFSPRSQRCSFFCPQS